MIHTFMHCAASSTQPVPLSSTSSLCLFRRHHRHDTHHADDEHRHRREQKDNGGHTSRATQQQRQEPIDERSTDRHRHHGTDKEQDLHVKPGKTVAFPNEPHPSERHPETKSKHTELTEEQAHGHPPHAAAAVAAPVEGPSASGSQVQKQAPNLGLSGKLAAETNKVDGVEMKFVPPAEARRCTKPRWRLYVFKGKDLVGDPLPLDRFPFFLFGKERKVVDIPIDHPSCSRQHAVICFR